MKLFKADIPLQDNVWNGAKPYLESALKKTNTLEWNINDVRTWIENQEGVLLLGIDSDEIRAAAAVGISTYHRQKKLEIYLMGADGDYGKLFPQVMQIAKGFGCTHINAPGRRWVKFLKQFGNVTETYICELELGE